MLIEFDLFFREARCAVLGCSGSCGLFCCGRCRSFCSPSARLHAAAVDLGWLSLTSDTPVTGLQQVSVTNQTGPTLCSDVYAACDNIGFLDWTLTVNFASGTPAIFLSDPNDPSTTIQPGTFSPFNWVFALTPAITDIVFAARIDPSSFNQFDPAANGAADPPVLFLSGGTFQTTLLVPAGFGDPNADPLTIYAQQELLVSDAPVEGVVPEPTFFLPLVLAWSGLYTWRRRLQ